MSTNSDAQRTDAEQAERTGLVQGIAAYTIWGFLPLYFVTVRAASPMEIVAQRVIWSLVLLLGLLAWRRQLYQLAALFRSPRSARALIASAVLIAINWVVYVYAVTTHQIAAASLGYFINPLVNVVLGVMVLREHLSRSQWLAVALASIGVAIIGAQSGAAIGISLTLALSFAVYGLIRKQAATGPLVGLAFETLMLVAPSLAYVAYLFLHNGAAFGTGVPISLLLMAGGIITATPLLLFAAAARALPYATVGLLQFLAPSIQFALAILWFGEPLSLQQLAGFVVIWAALAVYSYATFARRRPAADS